MGKDFFIEQTEIFYDELCEEALKKLRKEDDRYNKQQTAHVATSEELDEVLNGLPSREKEVIKKYINEKLDLHCIETKRIYLEGHRDCMRMLRHVQAFHD